MIGAVILDLDGVVTDTAEYHYLAWKKLADEEGVPFSRNDNDQLRGVSRRRSLELLLGDALSRYGEPQLLEMMDRKNAYYRDMLQRITRSDLLPGAADLIATLRRRGVKVAIGSASRNTPTVLDRLEIRHLFDAVSDGHSVVRPKPEPDVFVFAAGALQVPVAECAVVEDAEAGVRAARSAGMLAVGVGSPERVGHAHLRYDTTADIDVDAVLSAR